MRSQRIKNIKMHRILVPDCQHVDHKNHSGLDNRVYDSATDTGNIRPATASQNGSNRRRVRGEHSSIFKGVCRVRNKWRASIGVNGKKINLGLFEAELEASFSYQEAAKKYFGEFAYVENLDEHPQDFSRKPAPAVVRGNPQEYIWSD
jgi:hypothetical protein